MKEEKNTSPKTLSGKKIPLKSKSKNNVVQKKTKKRTTYNNDVGFNDDPYSANNCRDYFSENYLGLPGIF